MTIEQFEEIKRMFHREFAKEILDKLAGHEEKIRTVCRECDDLPPFIHYQNGKLKGIEIAKEIIRGL